VKRYMIILLLVASLATGVAYIMYNKPHRDPTRESAIQITSAVLFDNFNQDETNANSLYLDKVLEVTGRVLEVTTNQDQMMVVVLETSDPIFGVRCSMSSPVNVRVSEQVTVKGICTGFLSDVILTNSFLKEKLNSHE
jgi:hypothetical protein